MSYKFLSPALITFIVILFVGYVMKIMHWPYGQAMFYFGLIASLVSVSVIIINEIRKS